MKALFPILFFCWSGVAAESSTRLKSEIDFRVWASYDFHLDDTDVVFSRPILQQGFDYYVGGKDSGLRFSLDHRFRVDTEGRFGNGGQVDYDIQSLYGQWLAGAFDTRVGFQMLAWGETFGFPIADVINPWDLSEPWFLGFSHLKMPVFLLYERWSGEHLSVEFVWTPFPRHPNYQKVIDGLPVQISPNNRLRPFADSEFGFRVGYLFDSGFDLKFFHYRHHRRFPKLDTFFAFGSGALIVQKQSVQSTALSFSHASGPWIFRGDCVYQTGAGRSIQNILGADHTSDGGVVVGAQLHFDWFQQGMGKPELFGASFLLKYPLFNERLEPGMFFFSGLNHHDRWFAPRLGWNMSAAARFDVEWHRISPGGDGYKLLFEDTRWLYASLRYTF